MKKVSNNLITEIKIYPVTEQKGLLAFCSFILFENLYCSSVAIFTRPSGGFRLVYPTKKAGVKNSNIFYPITSELGKIIEEEILLKFDDVINNDRYCMSHSERE